MNVVFKVKIHLVLFINTSHTKTSFTPPKQEKSGQHLWAKFLGLAVKTEEKEDMDSMQTCHCVTFYFMKKQIF